MAEKSNSEVKTPTESEKAKNSTKEKQKSEKSEKKSMKHEKKERIDNVPYLSIDTEGIKIGKEIKPNEQTVINLNIYSSEEIIYTVESSFDPHLTYENENGVLKAGEGANVKIVFDEKSKFPESNRFSIEIKEYLVIETTPYKDADNEESENRKKVVKTAKYHWTHKLEVEVKPDLCGVWCMPSECNTF